jgi:hypothetical protein
MHPEFWPCLLSALPGTARGGVDPAWDRPYAAAFRYPENLIEARQIDVASPMLAQTCAAGKAIPKAKLEFMRADGQGEPIKYFEDSACYLAPTLRREL